MCGVALGIFCNHHGPPPQLAVNFHELDTRYHTVKIQRVCHHKVLVIHAAQHHAVQGDVYKRQVYYTALYGINQTKMGDA